MVLVTFHCLFILLVSIEFRYGEYFVDKETHCLKACGGRGGSCPSVCGPGGYCCRQHRPGCLKVPQSLPSPFNHTCVRYRKDMFTRGNSGTVTCPNGHTLVTDITKCQREVVDWSKLDSNRLFQGCFKAGAIGCFYNSDRGIIAFNSCAHSDKTDPEYKPVCERSPSENYTFGSGGTATCTQGYQLVTDLLECQVDVPHWSRKVFGLASCWKFGAVGCFINTVNNKISYSVCANRQGTVAKHSPVCKTNKIDSATTTAAAMLNTGPPTKLSASDMTVYQDDENTQIRCEADHNDVKYSWSFNGKPLNASAIQGMETCISKVGIFQVYLKPNILVICGLNFTVHQGIYTCTASNRFGSISKNITLSVFTQPQIPTLPSAIFIPYNSWRLLSCEVISNPPSKITWSKVIQDISSTGSGNPTGPSLKPVSRTSVINLTWAQGSGLYECRAENSVGWTISNVNVTMGPSPLYSINKVQLTMDARIYSIVIAVFCSAGIILAIIGTIKIIHIHRKKLKFTPHLSPNSEFVLDPNRSVQEQAADLPYNVNWEFPRLDVSLVRVIGEGNFGKVWEAMGEGISSFNPMDVSDVSIRSKMANLYKRHQSNDYFFKYFRKELYPKRSSDPQKIAVKCLRDNAIEKDIIDLASELKLMIHIGRHKNVVNLLGACTIDGPLWLLLEYCQHGDLLEFLRTRTKLLPQWEKDSIASIDKLCLLDLMKMTIDICDGMCFLSSKQVIHRDLSARNILVSANMQMKIADFGRARNSIDYGTEKDDLVPVRWLALESLQYGTYTTLSDVWAFGVVLWEVFTMGIRPYAGIPNRDIVSHLQNGKRLPSTEFCPSDVYEIMVSCWDETPANRPTFQQLFQKLSEIVRKIFAPFDDYYSALECSNIADAHVEDEFVNCDVILRNDRIRRLHSNGVSVTGEDFDRAMKRCKNRDKPSVSEVVTEVQ